MLLFYRLKNIMCKSFRFTVNLLNLNESGIFWMLSLNIESKMILVKRALFFNMKRVKKRIINLIVLYSLNWEKKTAIAFPKFYMCFFFLLLWSNSFKWKVFVECVGWVKIENIWLWIAERLLKHWTISNLKLVANHIRRETSLERKL